MTTIRELRRRMRSISDLVKICRAMEMVATAKMRRAQEQAMASRPYAEKITQVVADLAAATPAGEEIHPLLQRREVRSICLVHLSTDRGLCGGLNSNLNRLVADFVLKQEVPLSYIAVGRKARSFASRTRQNLIAEFTGLSDRPLLFDVLPIARTVIEEYSNGRADLVYLAFPRFVSTMVQRPVMEVILPVKPGKQAAGAGPEYIYEPSPEFILSELLPRYVEVRIYHAVLELKASEHSARMVAMRNARENADELIKELTLLMNKTRQELITKEICDITGGAQALTGI